MKKLRWLWAIPIFLVIIQLVPYGRSHTNPAVVAEPQWDSNRTRDLFRRACYDCHSNETVWPWYSNIAPVSWLVQHDVDEARRNLNFSEWNREQRRARDIAAEVEEGDMPQSDYLWMHPEAKLSPDDIQALADGAEKTFGPQERPDRKE